MTRLGTPLTAGARRVMLLGSGELGKEVCIELQRLGCETIAVDRYAQAPAMQVAHRSHVIDMRDPEALRQLIAREDPHIIVPEIEAIATEVLLHEEMAGRQVVPSARAAHLTMNREGIRRLAAEELRLATSSYRFADNYADFQQAVAELGMPCVVKPVMSSSGKGQSLVRSPEELETAWVHAQEGGRAGGGRVIVESFIAFDYEITLLTVKHASGISFCEPIGHLQQAGDYRESWQPQRMEPKALDIAREMARQVTQALGGWGVFGVEFFVQGTSVWFSEVSPRPHDTGLVTLISQNLSEFALHVRALLGLPIPVIRHYGPAASSALIVQGNSTQVGFAGLDQALSAVDTDLRLFGKPCVEGYRRMGVGLALGDSIEAARSKSRAVIQAIRIDL